MIITFAFFAAPFFVFIRITISKFTIVVIVLFFFPAHLTVPLPIKETMIMKCEFNRRFHYLSNNNILFCSTSDGPFTKGRLGQPTISKEVDVRHTLRWENTNTHILRPTQIQNQVEEHKYINTNSLG